VTEKLTAVYEGTEGRWWAVSVPEIPAANSQGKDARRGPRDDRERR
jgi:hypothetical protein